MSSSDNKNGDLEKHFLEAMKDKTIALPIVAIRILCDVLAASNAGVSYENVIRTSFRLISKFNFKHKNTDHGRSGYDFT